MISRPDRLLRLVLNIWLHRMTQAGRYTAVAAFLAASAGSAALEIPIYHLACAFASLLGVSLLMGFLVRRRVEIRGDFADRVSAGHSLTETFTIENRSRSPLYDAGISFFYLPPSIRQAAADLTVPHVPAGGSAPVPVTLEPRRRGLYELPLLTVYTVFPFNIWRKAVAKRDAGTLLVLPSFHPIGAVDIRVGPRYQPGGVTLTSNVGESPEYIGNRDYRPGRVQLGRGLGHTRRAGAGPGRVGVAALEKARCNGPP